MPAPIVLRNLIPPPKKGGEPPRIATRPDLRDGARGMGPIDPGPIDSGFPDFSNGVLNVASLTAINPLPRFTDIISGPATGLGDGLGDGVIVTVWGNGFGDQQGQVYFTDSLGTKRPAAHIYYWKKADGQAPGGPAQLWRSHLMYEIAFSIPSGSADGPGVISVAKAGGLESTETLPFTVRSGRILWVAPEGDNSNPGTFALPAQYLNAGAPGSSGLANNLLPGDTVYSRGVIEPNIDQRGLYVRGAEGTQAEHIALIAYPGVHTEVKGERKGILPYLSTGLVYSKYKVSVGASPEVEGQSVPMPGGGTWDNHIRTSQWGRCIGCYLVDAEGMCMQGQSGAVSSGGEQVDGFEMLGTHIFDVGCDGTSHFQHTTYFAIRRGLEAPVQAPRIEFNFLENCKAKYGIHVYDQPDQFGEWTEMAGELICRNNVIVNQKGAGINLEVVNDVGWTSDVYVQQNVLINCGLGPVNELNNGTSAEAITFRGSWLMDMAKVQDNLIYIYSDAPSREYDTPAAFQLGLYAKNPDLTVTGNIVVSDGDWTVVIGNPSYRPQNIATVNTGGGNIYHNLAGHSRAWPAEYGGVVADPQLVLDGLLVAPSVSSPMAGVPNALPYDLYGRPRTGISGPVEALA